MLWRSKLMAAALAVAMTSCLAGVAVAAHCPLDAKAIDNALSKLDVDAETRKEVEALRDEGMALHNAGKHGEAVEAQTAHQLELVEGFWRAVSYFQVALGAPGTNSDGLALGRFPGRAMQAYGRRSSRAYV